MAKKEKKEKIMKNMEFLVKELKKEWEVTKETKHSVKMTVEKAHELRLKVQDQITDYGEFLEENYNISFKESMEYCKENFVMLRFARKLVNEYNEAVAVGDIELILYLDKEEFKVYRSIKG